MLSCTQNQLPNSVMVSTKICKVKSREFEPRWKRYHFNKIVFFLEILQNQPNFYTFKPLYSQSANQCEWGTHFLLKFRPVRTPGHRWHSRGVNCQLKQSSYFYLIAQYTPIWEVVLTLVFTIKFHNLNRFFKTFKLPQGSYHVLFYTIFNFELNLKLVLDPLQTSVVVNATCFFFTQAWNCSQDFGQISIY